MATWHCLHRFNCSALTTGLVLLTVLLTPTLQAAQLSEHDQEHGELINFAFATWMGTGVYRVADRSVAVLNVPFYYSLREATTEQWGVELKLPVAVGSHSFEDLALDVQSFTFVPGIALNIPLSRRWRLKPYLQAGAGTDFSGGNDQALIYGVGVNLLGEHPYDGFDLLLGSGLLLAGSDIIGGGERLRFTKVDLGASLRTPASFRLWRRAVDIGLFAVATGFVNDSAFSLIENNGQSLEQMLEIGISLGMQEQTRILSFPLPRIGISYLFGDSLKGVKFNLGFPF